MRIRRLYKNKWTEGVLDYDGSELRTLELPYIDNQNNISCIPEGKYIVRLHDSKRFGKCLKVFADAECDIIAGGSKNTKRSDILLHSGNSVREYIDTTGFHWHADSRGCVLVGTVMRKDGILLNSRVGIKNLLSYMCDKEQDDLIIMEEKC